MACVPFSKPTIFDLFRNDTQGIWTHSNETMGSKSCAYNNGTLVVSGPNGSMPFSPAGTQKVQHKFFGTGNFVAVLTSETEAGPQQHWMSIVDFTALSIKAVPILNLVCNQNSPPWLQYSQGEGSLCLVGGSTASGISGLGVYRSDTGKSVCPGPPPLSPNQQIIGRTLAAGVEIMEGGTVIAGPCPYPGGELKIIPSALNFPTPVKIGGCPQPPMTAQITLRNVKDDCLRITGIAGSGAFSVTGTSQPLPADLDANHQMTATVTFAPGQIGNFSDKIVVTATPANGAGVLMCTGKAVVAVPGFKVSPGTVQFAHVLVGTTTTGSFTITNDGDTPIDFSLAPAAPGSLFQWSGWSGTLTCGASHLVDVAFTPQADGPATPVVATIVGSQGGTKTVTLTGDGCVPNAAIVVPPAPFPAFGDVREGYRTPRFITIANTGDDMLSFTATISGPDAALFGLMQDSGSITDVVATRTYLVAPTSHCGGGPIGSGLQDLAIVFFANAMPPHPAAAMLTIDAHNDATAPASFTFALAATVTQGNVVDVVAVFDHSGSMADAVPGGTKIGAAVQAGRLLVQLIPPDRGNRVAATMFDTTASTFMAIEPVTTGNQQARADAIKNPPLTPAGSTAIAAGAMVGGKEFATPHPNGMPADLTRAMIVLTDGKDNTAYLNPDDGNYYNILGIPARKPGSPWSYVNTQPLPHLEGVGVYAIGLGTEQDIDKAQLDALASATGKYYGVIDTAQPAVDYNLMKYYTQIYMDMVGMSVVSDPTYVIHYGDKHVIEFDILRGDVGALVVVYDLHGQRLPFHVESPIGEIIDASHVPPGYQLRTGFTDTSRFYDVLMPPGEPKRYAGRWKVIVAHDGRVCFGRPVDHGKRPVGFQPRECRDTKSPVEYGIAIGAGSNFRLQAYVTPGPVKIGEPILLTGVPSEAGLSVPGCTVTVEAVAPDGTKWDFDLRDDGGHQDSGAGDGEYARLFPKTAMPGSYTFTFRVTGFTRDGEPVKREAVRSKYVEGHRREPPVRDPRDEHGERDVDCRRVLAVLEAIEQRLERMARATRT